METEEITRAELEKRRDAARARSSAIQTEAPAERLGDSLDFGGPEREVPCSGCGEVQLVPALFRSVKLMCAPCRDRSEEVEARERTERERERRAAHLVEEKARRLEAWPEWLAAISDTPDEHLQACLSRWPESTVPGRVARHWLTMYRAGLPRPRLRGLYLFGPTGVGKTDLAVATVRELYLEVPRKPPTVYLDWSRRFVRRVQAGYRTGEADALIESRIQADIWILDDAGTERATGDGAGIISEILVCRALRPTWITSNHSADGWSDGNPALDRVGSRLGYFDDLEISGKDRRYGDAA